MSGLPQSSAAGEKKELGMDSSNFRKFHWKKQAERPKCWRCWIFSSESFVFLCLRSCIKFHQGLYDAGPWETSEVEKSE